MEIFEFKLPDLGEGLTEGIVVQWLVRNGSEVEEHQSIVEIETDKSIYEIPSPRKGKLIESCRKPGDTIKVGEVLFKVEVT